MMTKNYLDMVIDDLVEFGLDDMRKIVSKYQDETGEFDGYYEELEDELLNHFEDNDEITGNGSGEYYLGEDNPRVMARNQVLDFMSTVEEMIDELYGHDEGARWLGEKILNDDWGTIDACCRVFVLRDAIKYVLKDEFGIEEEI